MLEEDGFKGYDSHKGHPCILQSVNSMFNNAFTENMEQVYLDHREYRGQPTEPLLLLFIQQLQEYPLSSNSSMCALVECELSKLPARSASH